MLARPVVLLTLFPYLSSFEACHGKLSPLTLQCGTSHLAECAGNKYVRSNRPGKRWFDIGTIIYVHICYVKEVTVELQSIPLLFGWLCW